MRTAVLHHFHTFHPEAQAEFDRLAHEEKRMALALARRGEDPPPRRRASDPPDSTEADLAAVRAAMDAQRAIIASGVVAITVKGLSRREYRRMRSDHPPRDGEDLDQRVGYNADSFGDALIQACIVSTADLDGTPVPNEWDAWADDMTNGQWEDVFAACMRLSTDGNPSLPR